MSEITKSLRGTPRSWGGTTEDISLEVFLTKQAETVPIARGCHDLFRNHTMTLGRPSSILVPNVVLVPGRQERRSSRRGCWNTLP